MKNKSFNIFFRIFGGSDIYLLVGARNLSKCPDPPKPQEIANFSKPPGQTAQRRQSKNVGQREHGTDEPKKSRKYREMPGYGRNDDFVLPRGLKAANLLQCARPLEGAPRA